MMVVMMRPSACIASESPAHGDERECWLAGWLTSNGRDTEPSGSIYLFSVLVCILAVVRGLVRTQSTAMDDDRGSLNINYYTARR